MTPYRLVRRRSTAGEFHARAIPEPPMPELWVHEITAPALVLGSTQRNDIVDLAACRRAGIDVVRRRSGGGAVMLVPDQVVWVDLILPAGGPGWADDVHAPMVWFGEHLAASFVAAGVDGVATHRGAMVNTEWSRLVCFDGLGPGEVTSGDAKLVGISQRRTRHAARLQACWYSTHDPSRLTELLLPEVDPASLHPVATVPPALAAAVPALLLDAIG